MLFNLSPHSVKGAMGRGGASEVVVAAAAVVAVAESELVVATVNVVREVVNDDTGWGVTKAVVVAGAKMSNARDKDRIIMMNSIANPFFLDKSQDSDWISCSTAVVDSNLFSIGTGSLRCCSDIGQEKSKSLPFGLLASPHGNTSKS